MEAAKRSPPPPLASPDRVRACLSRSFFAMIKEILLLLLLLPPTALLLLPSCVTSSSGPVVVGEVVTATSCYTMQQRIPMKNIITNIIRVCNESRASISIGHAISHDHFLNMRFIQEARLGHAIRYIPNIERKETNASSLSGSLSFFCVHSERSNQALRPGRTKEEDQ